MLKYLLDTNIVIYTMKNRPQHVTFRLQKVLIIVFFAA